MSSNDGRVRAANEAREDHSGNSHGAAIAVAPTAPPTAAMVQGETTPKLPDSGPQRERVATLIIVEMTRNCGAGD